MPVFRLDRRPIFPPPALARPDGLLAIGGDLSQRRLLEAYRQGIFPWYDQPGGPILWWSPDPRLVLFPDELHVTKRLRRTIRQGRFEVRHNSAFAAVIRSCAEVERSEGSGTWITPEMQTAYIALHQAGFAECAECRLAGRLVGGIYGVRMGRAFFGESMFHIETDASKVALVALVERLKIEGVTLIDCQVRSDHLVSLGAREVPRSEFLKRLESSRSSRFP